MKRQGGKFFRAFYVLISFLLVIWYFFYVSFEVYGKEPAVTPLNREQYLEAVAEEFGRIFRNTKVLGADETEIEGLYIIFLLGKGDEIKAVYYYPMKGLVIFGEIWTINGTSLTGNQISDFIEKLKASN